MSAKKIDVIEYILPCLANTGYHQEVQSNVKAALQARVYSLMIGSRGVVLNTPKSVPVEELLAQKSDLNNGQRQKMLADHLGYTYAKPN